MIQARIEPYGRTFVNYSGTITSVTDLFKKYLRPLYDWSDEPSIIVKQNETIEYLKQDYELIDPPAIKAFLLGNAFLIDFLLEAIGKIDGLFGFGTRKVLELVIDPDENFEELFIVIKSNYSAEEARTLLNSLMDEWFLDVIDRTRGLLNITEETA